MARTYASGRLRGWCGRWVRRVRSDGVRVPGARRIVEGGGETRVAGVGKRAGGGGSEPRATRADRRSGTGRTISPCGRGRSPAGGRGGEGFGEEGQGRVGRAGWREAPRNEQRTTDAFEGAVARSRRGARASHRHVRELSRGDDEFRWDGGVRRRHRGVRTVAHTDPERCPRHRLSSHRLPPPRAPGRTSSRVARESLERPARRRVD